MAQAQILSEESITTVTLNKELGGMQKRDGELSFRAGKTMDHLNHLGLEKPKDNEARVKALQALEIPRLKDTHIHKIVDLMPNSVKELGVILSGYTLAVNKENQQKIIGAL